MRYFLLVYDQLKGEVLEFQEFQDHERLEALAARFEREAQTLRQTHIEVVVLGAESREALERTHARYFKSPRQILLAGA
ncbi:MAG: hypothetical protein ACRD0K_05345 [Egibacteraceae bacterium]